MAGGGERSRMVSMYQIYGSDIFRSSKRRCEIDS